MMINSVDQIGVDKKYSFPIHICQENIDLKSIDLLYIGTMSKNLKDEISQFVIEARNAMGLTQPQLAEKLGCTKGNVSAWENSRHQPSYAQMLWMSEESGVPMPHDNVGKILKELGINIKDLKMTNMNLLKAAVNVPEEDEAQAERILTTFSDEIRKKK